MSVSQHKSSDAAHTVALLENNNLQLMNSGDPARAERLQTAQAQARAFPATCFGASSS
jgi:hypothetical protein